MMKIIEPRNHIRAFKAKEALEALKGEQTTVDFGRLKFLVKNTSPRVQS